MLDMKGVAEGAAHQLGMFSTEAALTSSTIIEMRRSRIVSMSEPSVDRRETPVADDHPEVSFPEGEPDVVLADLTVVKSTGPLEDGSRASAAPGCGCNDEMRARWRCFDLNGELLAETVGERSDRSRK